MTINRALYIPLFLLASCKNAPQTEVPISHVAIANKFIDAFYSFNRDSLQSMLFVARESQPNILYYQKWAECANYDVINRDHYFEKNDSVVIVPVTVKDDLMGALKIDFNVTDTFHISIRNGSIRSVTTASNDLAEYYEAKAWVKQNYPELIEKACEGIWEGGPTPCECVKAMVKGFAEFKR
jgi:hypothetical protein